MITIETKDSTYIKLSFTDEEEWRTVYDYFSIKIPNAEFIPSVKAGLSDGLVKFLNAKNEMLLGLKGKLIHVLKNSNIDYVDNTIKVQSDINIEEFKEFLGKIHLELDMKPYPHQLKLVWNCINDQRGIGLAATSSGKSFSLYLIMRYYLMKGVKIFQIVPSIDLVTQMKENMMEYYETKELRLLKEIDEESDDVSKALLQSELKQIYQNRKDTNAVDLDSKISMIFGGQDKYQNKPITISTFQSLDIANNRVQREYFNDVDVLLVDETHRASGETLATIIETCVNSFVKYGVSGSLDSDIINNLKVEGLMGEVKKVVSFSELAELGLVTPTYIQPIYLKYNEETCKQLKKMSWAEQDKMIRNHGSRNRFLSRLSNSFPDENVLVITKNLDASETLATEISNIRSNNFIEAKKDIKKLQKLNDINVFYSNSSTKPLDRENMKKKLENSTGNVLIAIDKLISTGISIKQLHKIIFTNIQKSTILVQQSIGRGARLHKNKEKTVIYDIVDYGVYYSRSGKAYNNKHYQHFLERLDIYYAHDYTVLEPKQIQLD